MKETLSSRVWYFGDRVPRFGLRTLFLVRGLATAERPPPRHHFRFFTHFATAVTSPGSGRIRAVVSLMMKWRFSSTPPVGPIIDLDTLRESFFFRAIPVSPRRFDPRGRRVHLVTHFLSVGGVFFSPFRPNTLSGQVFPRSARRYGRPGVWKARSACDSSPPPWSFCLFPLDAF